MKEIKRILILRREELLIVLGCTVAGFLVGEIILGIAIAVSGEKELFDLGTLLALILPYAVLGFMGMVMLSSDFNQAVSFADTRKRFVPVYLVVTFAECMAAAVAARLLGFVEQGIFHTVYAGLSVERSELFVTALRWKYILVAALALTGIQAFFGALFVKYGRAAFWVMWGLYMVFMLGIPRLSDYLASNAHMQWVSFLIQNITLNRILGTIGAVGAVLVLIGYAMLRRQQVNI